ncbi:Fic family protein [Corynebacterium mendelii]|uniref:Fic family protein n=1 Tax=Corynebacterium mendelii TaxID=2765362 RepID=A0A939DZD8_9CORY|nr:Fic family protein [Corynebacterium mendelii]MBN9643843.1 Fic family protein [Corynebacterium mendelii]
MNSHPTAGIWIDQTWSAPDQSGYSKRSRLSGTFKAFIPERLSKRDLRLSQDVAAQALRVQQQLTRLATRPDTGVLEDLSRFLARSESIASSHIEGMAPGADKVAVAEFLRSKQPDKLPGSVAEQVAANMEVLSTLVRKGTGNLTVEDLQQCQASLVPQRNLHGIRTVQNWIGGNQHNPIGAAFVPPPPEEVPCLMADFIDYVNGAHHSVLAQAAIAHAQFETIHPFADGNGRIGRALIHTILSGSGLCGTTIIPVSLVLANNKDAYIAALSSFRDVRNPTQGLDDWCSYFLDSMDCAIDQVTVFNDAIEKIRLSWQDKLFTHRTTSGKTRALRSDSAEARILANLPEMPLVTVDLAVDRLEITATAARRALTTLVEAGILTKRSIAKRTNAYLTLELFDLMTMTERRLASPALDTSVAPPAFPVPAINKR